MKVLQVHFYGDPGLREESQPVEAITPALRDLAEAMIQTMHAQLGIGLAAQQVGRTESVCVIDLPEEMDLDDEGQRLNPGAEMPMVLFNPQILTASKRTTGREEGCLSFPDINGRIDRPWSITVRYLNLAGNTIEMEASGMLARVLQHEIDHLNGVLFIDRMSHVKRLALKGKLKRLRQEQEA